MKLKVKDVLALGIPVLAAVLLVVAAVPAFAQQAVKAPAAAQSYTAELTTVNQNIAGNSAKGSAQFKISGDELDITITGEGLTPDMMILAHIHGKADGTKVMCATQAADTNKDGFVDVVEDETVSGPIVVALNGEPADLDFKAKSYPKSDKQGMIQYTKKVKLSKLMKNLNKKEKMTALNLENMVVNLHGVNKKTALPSTVKSEAKLPAWQTIPIACGEIKKSKQ